jgi:membrane protease YdiL (CAAX protease family)
MTEFDFILALVGVTIGFLLYLFDTTLPQWIWKILEKPQRDPAVWRIYIQRMTGFIWLGIFPLLMMTVPEDVPGGFYGLFVPGPALAWYVTLGLAILILVVNFFNAPRQDNLAMYPQIRKSEWTYSILAGSALTWFLYLCAYELLFRGILLFSSLAVMDQMTAIALNSTIYAFAHIPKGRKEAVASIPFGILMCLLSIESQSVWPAIIVHSFLALSNEWFSLYYHPGISIKKST